MSLREELGEALSDTGAVEQIEVTKDAEVHGEPATVVRVRLADGREIIGTFTTESKAGFGGVEFDSRKNIPQLMRAKVESVLAGTAEESV
jgi:hypothetical protein